MDIEVVEEEVGPDYYSNQPINDAPTEETKEGEDDQVECDAKEMSPVKELEDEKATNVQTDSESHKEEGKEDGSGTAEVVNFDLKKAVEDDERSPEQTNDFDTPQKKKKRLSKAEREALRNSRQSP